MTTRAGESKSPLFLEMFGCQHCVYLFSFLFFSLIYTSDAFALKTHDFPTDLIVSRDF